MARVDFRKRDLCRLPDILNTMQEMANDSWNQGNYETLYIFLKRWLNTVEWQRTTDCKNDEPFITVDKIMEMKNQLERVEQMLNVCYENISSAKSIDDKQLSLLQQDQKQEPQDQQQESQDQQQELQDQQQEQQEPPPKRARHNVPPRKRRGKGSRARYRAQRDAQRRLKKIYGPKI